MTPEECKTTLEAAIAARKAMTPAERDAEVAAIAARRERFHHDIYMQETAALARLKAAMATLRKATK